MVKADLSSEGQETGAFSLLASLHSVKEEGNHLLQIHVGLRKRELVVKPSGIL